MTICSICSQPIADAQERFKSEPVHESCVPENPESGLLHATSVTTETISIDPEFEGDMVGAVPIKELEQLVEEWRDQDSWAAVPAKERRRELDALIEEHSE